jgi:hypothetical protein
MFSRLMGGEAFQHLYTLSPAAGMWQKAMILTSTGLTVTFNVRSVHLFFIVTEITNHP